MINLDNRTRAASVHHTLKGFNLLSSWAARSASNQIATAKLLASGIDAQTWNELLQMQEAVWRRQWQLSEDWIRGWTAWTQEFAQIKGANTMSKLVEQEFNMVARLGQLLSDQATDLVALRENIEVDYAYWVNEKVS
jgi:hypothetical protein